MVLDGANEKPPAAKAGSGGVLQLTTLFFRSLRSVETENAIEFKSLMADFYSSTDSTVLLGLRSPICARVCVRVWKWIRGHKV